MSEFQPLPQPTPYTLPGLLGLRAWVPSSARARCQPPPPPPSGDPGRLPGLGLATAHGATYLCPISWAMVTPRSKPVSSVMRQLHEEEQAPPSWVTPRTCRLPSGSCRSNLREREETLEAPACCRARGAEGGKVQGAAPSRLNHPAVVVASSATW